MALMGMDAISITGGRTALDVAVASSFLTRGRGLLGRPPLEEAHGLLIRPCNSVHTWFMRQSLDLVGLGNEVEGRAEITWLSADVRPWRFRWASRGTKQILELPAGEIARAGLEVGRTLQLH